MLPVARRWCLANGISERCVLFCWRFSTAIDFNLPVLGDRSSTIRTFWLTTPSSSGAANLMVLIRIFCSLVPICGSASMAALWLAALLLGMSNSLRADEPLAPTIILRLKRGPFGTYHFAPTGTARAVVLFGSGDGGCGQLETRVCSFLASQGIYTVGIDCSQYAETAHDSATLTADFAAITQDALTRTKNPDLPVMYGGWSMGAVQAAAAAAEGPARRHQLDSRPSEICRRRND